MTRSKLFLLLNALLYVLLAVLVAAAAIGLYREGAAVRASGDALFWIFTREKAAQRLSALAPLLFLALGMSAAGLILGIGADGAKKPAQVQPPFPLPAHPRRTAAVRCAVLIAALGMILAGILNGSMRDVLVKAINLCMECVGLG